MKKLGRFIGNDEGNYRVGYYIIDKYNVFRNQAYYGILFFIHDQVQYIKAMTTVYAYKLHSKS